MTSAVTLPQSDLSTQDITTTIALPASEDLSGDRWRQAVVQTAATMECERYTAGGRAPESH